MSTQRLSSHPKGGLVEYFVLTNNPLVQDQVSSHATVVFKSGGIRDILEEAACYVARGHRLLTHPLSGSVKPGETPYKSMLMSCIATQKLDVPSARLVSNALDACDKFTDKTGSYSKRTLRDLQVVDASLIGGAMRSAGV